MPGAEPLHCRLHCAAASRAPLCAAEPKAALQSEAALFGTEKQSQTRLPPDLKRITKQPRRSRQRSAQREHAKREYNCVTYSVIEQLHDPPNQ